VGGATRERAKAEKDTKRRGALLCSTEWLKLEFSRRENKKTGKKGGEAHSFIQGELYKKTKKKVK
jgi:hypothetical protein